MSERLDFIPNNPEDEPVARLLLQNGEIEATRFNTSLHRHLGNLAIHNFIMNDNEPDDPKEPQALLFSFVEGYPRLEQYMVENNYPIHDNLTQVSAAVVAAYERAMDAYLDVVPDWME